MAPRALRVLVQSLSTCLLLLTSCGNAPPAPVAPTAPTQTVSAVAVTTPPETQFDHTQAPVPVAVDDLTVGSWNAPVTVVAFLDLECPYCGRVMGTIKEAQRKYGSTLRLVVKHNPLPFHSSAYESALATATVRALAGNDAGFKFLNKALEGQRELSEQNLERWASECGVAPVVYRGAMDSRRFARIVDNDIELAKRLGANGTPAFRINGVTVVGAQPLAEFTKVIDEQLAAAKGLFDAGTPPGEVYVKLTTQNIGSVATPTDSEHADKAKPDEDLTVWRIPVFADDPQLGPANAPVTLVVFSDFECPFCQRSEATLKEVRERYGDKVRVVWKDNPLPMHEVAPYASALGRLVYAKRGNAAFWALHDALFQDQTRLMDRAKEEAAHYGISVVEVADAIDRGKVKTKLEQTEDLAISFKVRGAPQFFINGVRLKGAQPIEAFAERIDAALARVQPLLEQGVPQAKLYDAVLKGAQDAEPQERKHVALPTGTRPSRGGANAKVTLQLFSDFQCPFCKRMGPVLSSLEKEFPGQLRIVWRHYPLPFHQNAKSAAQAAEAAYAQRGNKGFWAFHDRLFDNQNAEGGLGRETLERIAGEIGLDLAKFKKALDESTYDKVIEADEQAAHDAGINGTPAAVINGYFVSGAQPLAVFRRVVRMALSEGNAPKAK